MNIIWLSFVSATALAAFAAPAEQTYDFVLRHGRVIDGAGNPAFYADVAVRHGRISAIGRIPPGAGKDFDATGCVITPGFVDVHTHAEEIPDIPGGENFLRSGVTTVVMGNCGDSALPLGKFFKKLEKMGFGPNMASLLGASVVREKAMGGSFDRKPTEAEMDKMRAMMDQAMKDGAVGLSTGLIYPPGVFASTAELIELCKVVSKYDGIYATHQRSESEHILDSLDEIFRIAREAGVRAEVSHIKLSGPANWGRADKVLAAIEKARAEGLDITQDQYAYTASSTGISQLIPEFAKDGGHKEMVKRFDDPAQKARIVGDMRDLLKHRGSPDFSYAVIASYKHDPSYNGLNLAEAAQKMRGASSVDDQIETVLEMERHDGASGIFHGMSEDDLAVFMRHPNTMFGCDAGVRNLSSPGVPHPRGYGNAARILGLYVREKQVLRLEDAVRKMTTLPANTFHLKQRGEIREGNWADLAVFNPGTVTDRATFKNPHQFSTGFKYVFVNGVAVVQNDEYTGAKPGKILRHGAQP